MKKLIIFTVFVLFVHVSSTAQFTTSGTTTTTTNDVGIGTTTPYARLEVLADPNYNPTTIIHTSGNQGWGHALTLTSDGSSGDDVRILFAYRHAAKTWSIGGWYDQTTFGIFENGGDGGYGSGYGTPRFSVAAGGNVGIGTSGPSAMLSISGTSSTTANTGTPAISDFYGVYSRTRLAIGNSTTTANGSRSSAVLFYSQNTAGTAYQNNWEVGNDYNQSGNNDFYFYSCTSSSPVLYLSASGNVLIGQTTQSNSSYKLDVKGNVRANSVVINTTGADFVFEPAYKLRPLADLKNYIDQNHHLPEIESAKQMQANGLNIGDNQTKLLQKIEELTLYLIEKDKKTKQQDTKIKELDEARKAQDERIKILEEKLDKLVESNNKF